MRTTIAMMSAALVYTTPSLAQCGARGKRQKAITTITSSTDSSHT